MKKSEKTGLDVEIDKLTNSIENVITGDSFTTEISLISSQELKGISKMKSKSKNLDVDFIGGQGPLTKSEEKAISEFIKSQKIIHGTKPNIKANSRNREKLRTHS